MYQFVVNKDAQSRTYQISYCFNMEADPKIFYEAIKFCDHSFWKQTINDEINSIMGNNTQVLVDLPPGSKAIECKLIFKKKMKVDGTINRFKARASS